MHTRSPQHPERTAGLAVLFGGATAQQTGAALAASLFGSLGIIGVLAVRQIVMAATHIPLGRPNLRRLSRTQLLLGIALGLVMSSMNLFLYLAIDRIGLGLAVTVEFLGPLTLALVASRGALNVVCALVGAGGVVLLTRPDSSGDPLGLLLGAGAGASWAGYILLNKAAGARLPGLQATALASATSVVLFVPAAMLMVDAGALTPRVLLIGLAAGLLASALPYAADLFVLRRLPAGLYSIMMSIHPVVAALAGLVILHEVLGLLDMAAIALICTANIIVVLAGSRARRRRAPLPIGD